MKKASWKWTTMVACGALVLSGCVSNVTVKKPLMFGTSGDKIHKVVGVYLTPETLTRKYESRFIRMWLGDVLDRNIDAALGEVFDRVVRVNSPDSFENGVDQIATVSFNSGTKTQAPLTVFGELTCHVKLDCVIKTADGKVSWEGNGVGEGRRSMGSTFFFGQIALYSVVENVIKTSMAEALDDLSKNIQIGCK